MSFYKHFPLIPLILFFVFVLPIKSYAQEEKFLPVVTVINPIRGSEWHEKTDILASLKAQWKVMQHQKVNATWLWQYTALEDDRMVSFAKEQMKDQEFGVFLEVDRNTAAKAGVQYRGQGALYQSDGLLLVSYDRNERRKLIDAIFKKFKETFGYYPKTVGAWWIGGDSLTYMQKKYGIVAAMKAADQYELDAYTIWGGPWSIPFVASRENEGIPANSWEDSSKVVIIQWAPRDPLNGYTDPMFSLQDYGISGYPFSYVDYLSTIFLRNPLDNVNVGLENGGRVEQFTGYYDDKLAGAKKLKKDGKIEILLVKDYAEKFLSRRKIFANSDAHYFLSKDYKTDDQSFWYHSTNFKAGIHKRGDKIYLIDLRDYSKKVQEDFSLLPNSQGHLRVSTPYLIDSMKMPADKLLIANGKEQMEVTEKDGVVVLVAGDKKIAEFTKSSLEIFADRGGVKKFTFDGKQHDKRIVINALLPYFPLNKSTLLVVTGVFFAIALVLVLLSVLLYKKTTSRKVLIASLVGIPLALALIGGLIYFSRTTYVVTPFEMKALQVIKEKKRDVIFIEEYDFGIRPIYKAVKPLLYVNYRFGEILTGTDWQVVQRPENNVLRLSEDEDRLVVVPRYLGADFSKDEMRINNYKKVFDNGQIAIFERK